MNWFKLHNGFKLPLFVYSSTTRFQRLVASWSRRDQPIWDQAEHVEIVETLGLGDDFKCLQIRNNRHSSQSKSQHKHKIRIETNNHARAFGRSGWTYLIVPSRKPEPNCRNSTTKNWRQTKVIQNNYIIVKPINIFNKYRNKRYFNYCLVLKKFLMKNLNISSFNRSIFKLKRNIPNSKNNINCSKTAIHLDKYLMYKCYLYPF
jgi:hypothetical protein